MTQHIYKDLVKSGLEVDGPWLGLEDPGLNSDFHYIGLCHAFGLIFEKFN